MLHKKHMLMKLYHWSEKGLNGSKRAVFDTCKPTAKRHKPSYLSHCKHSGLRISPTDRLLYIKITQKSKMPKLHVLSLARIKYFSTEAKFLKE